MGRRAAADSVQHIRCRIPRTYAMITTTTRAILALKPYEALSIRRVSRLL